MDPQRADELGTHAVQVALVPDVDARAALRDARQHRGLSLEQIARTTKISLANLRNLEADDPGCLPAPVFLRGFVKAYAREVGLDPEATARDYLRQAGLVPPPPDAAAVSEADAPRHPADTTLPSAGAPLAAALRERYRWVGIAALVVAVAGYAMLRGQSARHGGAAGPSTAASVGVQSAGTDTRPVATTGSPGTAAPVPGRGDAFRLEISAQAPCWVSAVVDGRRSVYRLFAAGDRQTLDVRSDVVLRVGDPAAVTIAINGARGRQLGRPGAPVTTRITTRDYYQFIAP